MVLLIEAKWMRLEMIKPAFGAYGYPIPFTVAPRNARPRRLPYLFS